MDPRSLKNPCISRKSRYCDAETKQKTARKTLPKNLGNWFALDVVFFPFGLILQARCKDLENGQTGLLWC